jgi:hypothetical protein
LDQVGGGGIDHRSRHLRAAGIVQEHKIRVTPQRREVLAKLLNREIRYRGVVTSFSCGANRAGSCLPAMHSGPAGGRQPFTGGLSDLSPPVVMMPTLAASTTTSP